MKEIIYLGSFRFPEQDAASKRVHSIGCILRDIGYTVIFAGGQKATSNYLEGQKYDGFTYYSMGELDLGNRNIFRKILDFFHSGNSTLIWLESYTRERKVEKIIIYNSSYIFLKKVIEFCKKRNIEVICDITEWYDSSTLPGGRFGLVSIDNAIKMLYAYKKVSKKILISKYLFNYYLSDKSKKVIVPPLFVENYTFERKYINERINIIYAGSPANKDYIDLMLQTYINNINKLPRLVFNIFGIDKVQFEKKYNIDVFGDIYFHGRISYFRVLEEYKKAHFSFILRPSERYSDAGFPTKVIESLSQSTPLIANISSDLDSYLIDNVNSYIIKDLKEESILKTLIKINELTDEDYHSMQTIAFEVSKNFHYKKYYNTIKDLID